ncbi:MAG: hypothetical protein M3R06_00260, partial [Chloroflexota bacterium]|nr:hypothetical protein [Chloroflexota bacterium]
ELKRDRERRDNDFARELERVAGDERALTARADAARKELARLDGEEITRGNLVPLLAAEPELSANVAALDRERDRANRMRQLENDLARVAETVQRVIHGLGAAVAEPGPGARAIDGWCWDATDAANVVVAAERLVAIATTVDSVGARARAEILAGCRACREKLDEKLNELSLCRNHHEKLTRERNDLLGPGDPEKRVAEATASRERALKEGHQASSQVAEVERQREGLISIVRNFRAQRFETVCPTCARPFSAADAEVTTSALEDRIATLQANAMALHDAVARARGQAEEAERAVNSAQDCSRQVVTLNGRIEVGDEKISTLEEEFSIADRRRVEVLADAGLKVEPSEESVAEARAWASLVTAIESARPLLERLREEALRAVQERTEVHAQLTDLGPVAYDAEVHQEANAKLREARDAGARIAEINRGLDRRPTFRKELADVDAASQTLIGTRMELVAQRDDIGFDANALKAAIVAENTARTAERLALDERHVAQSAHQDAVSAASAIRAEHERTAGLVSRADTRQRDADGLGRMYSEFTHFDRYVARQVTPLLADYTSELLKEATDDRYDQVTFDDDYGIRVYDGQHEHFPIEQFSGGERDVIALCARLALSRLIGGQAARPPGFLVLDEIFGSLDRDRRARVLEILGSLAEPDLAFRQLFIISHVDDVRASPIFDEVWRIAETVDGGSHVEKLTADATLEDA